MLKHLAIAIVVLATATAAQADSQRTTRIHIDRPLVTEPPPDARIIRVNPEDVIPPTPEEAAKFEAECKPRIKTRPQDGMMQYVYERKGCEFGARSWYHR